MAQIEVMMCGKCGVAELVELMVPAPEFALRAGGASLWCKACAEGLDTSESRDSDDPLGMKVGLKTRSFVSLDPEATDPEVNRILVRVLRWASAGALGDAAAVDGVGSRADLAFRGRKALRTLCKETGGGFEEIPVDRIEEILVFLVWLRDVYAGEHYLGSADAPDVLRVEWETALREIDEAYLVTIAIARTAGLDYLPISRDGADTDRMLEARARAGLVRRSGGEL